MNALLKTQKIENDYKKSIQKQINSEIKSEFFKQEIFFDFECKSVKIDIVFDIHEINKLSRNNFTYRYLSYLDVLNNPNMITFSIDDLQDVKLKKGPLTLAYYPNGKSPFYLINGNHRLKKYIELKKNNIEFRLPNKLEPIHFGSVTDYCWYMYVIELAEILNKISNDMKEEALKIINESFSMKINENAYEIINDFNKYKNYIT